jgi:TatD DNase family protein
VGRLPEHDRRKLEPAGLGGILHCFTGSVEHARRALDMGFMISFAGNITFPKAQPIRDAAQMVPLDRMLIETDSPYLAPIPHRGQRNEPAFVAEVARQIGELRGLPAEEIGAQTTQNFYNSLDSRPSLGTSLFSQSISHEHCHPEPIAVRRELHDPSLRSG